MIRLQKTNKPQVLVDHGDAWTQTLLQKRAAGQKATAAEKTRYRHPDIKNALVAETHGKCAYCESKLRHIHHGDVEHMMPKSLELEKILQWENLTLTCEICNQNKSSADPNAENIIDPYAMEPMDHLMFVGPFIFDRGTPLGVATREILDLKRPELVERRIERMEAIMSLVATICRPDIPVAARRAIYRDMMLKEAAPSSPYSAMTRDLIDSVRNRLPADVL